MGGFYMRTQRFNWFFKALLLMVCFNFLGCSDKSPVAPETDQTITGTVPQNSAPNHMLLAEYNVTFRDILDANGNTVDMAMDVEPVRTPNFHFDVVVLMTPPVCSDCLQFELASFTPGYPESTFTVTMLAYNPYVGITAYDLRCIIQPPATMCSLDNADGWTTLYNEVAPDPRNPYVAYNKETMNRPFTGGEWVGTSGIFRKDNAYKLVEMVFKMDVSFPDNCAEPVDCWVAPLDGPVYPNGSNVWVIARVTDWQNDLQSVELDLTEFNGSATPVPMAKIDEDPVAHTTTWQYLISQGADLGPDNHVGPRRIWLRATDPVESHSYYKALNLECVYDYDPPVWKNPLEVGIYDHISSPQYLWLFYHEAFDVSLPIQYIFYGNNQSSPFDGQILNVKNDWGVNQLGVGEAPDNVKRWFGIRLMDAQGWSDTDMSEYSCTRHSMDARWSRLDSVVGNLDGILGSPAIGDVDGDGVDDIVVGSRNHTVYAYHGNGTGNQDTRIWTHPDAGKAGDEIQSSPALVDLNNDGKQDVVVSADDVKVYAFSGADGLPLWIYTSSAGYLMRGSPSIAYLNGDNVPDVVAGTGEGLMIGINGSNGAELWTFATGSGIAGTPGVADVTGDGIADVFFGSYDTKVYCVNGATGAKVWHYYIGPALYNVSASPAIVDVNGDTVPDCIISAVNNQGDSIGAVYALNGINGNLIWSNGDIYGNPKLGPAPTYINDDDVMDFIVTASLAEVYHFYGIDGATGETIYNRLAQGINPSVKTSFTAPIIGDFTGDGHLNAMIGREDGFVDLINVGDLNYPGDFGGKSLFSAMASTGPNNTIYGDPAVGDVDGDNQLELVVANLRGFVFVLDMYVAVPGDVQLRGWTQHSGNRWHTGTPFFEPPQ